jgi:lipopolysaccharide export system protein LptA
MNAVMKPASLLSLSLLLLLTAGPAMGQGAVSALKGHDSNAPVDVAADRIELQDRSDRAVLSGNVNVQQGDLNLTAQRLTVAYARTGGTQIQRLDAAGGVTVRSPSETARGEFAIYDLDRRLITMLGGVVLTRGGSEVRGGRLVIDLTSGRATVDGSAVGGAAGTGTQGGRVTGRFTVPQRTN